jgi:hypothetical protein
MAKNTLAVFAKDPIYQPNKITATTTDKTGATTTNMKLLHTVPTDDAKYTRVEFKHEGTSGAGIALVWVVRSSVAYLIREQTYSAITSSTTVATAEARITENDWQFVAGDEIWVGATVVTSTIVAHLFGGKLAA